MTSYQRRLRDIKYLTQVVNERTALCCAIVGYAKKEGHQIKIPLAYKGIKGDDFLTDTADFSMHLASATPESLIKESRGP